jgi:hypothetical protein
VLSVVGAWLGRLPALGAFDWWPQYEAAVRRMHEADEAGIVAGGLAALWPDTDPERLSAGQAQALATVHDSMGHDKFEAAWRAMLEQAAAA